MYESEDEPMNFLNKGVTAPKGFSASGIHCGIKKDPGKLDLALVLAEAPCAAAAVYTKNIVQAAPVKLTKKHLADGRARAFLVNSGNANACAPNDEDNALKCCKALSQAAGIDISDIIAASTGVIGQELPAEKIIQAADALFAGLRSGDAADEDAAKAIMTTDLTVKQIACTFVIDGADVTIGAAAKGSGMIHPNMATMLCFITTDCNISQPMLQAALTNAVNRSFNRISVDGDTSTNDMAAILASGLAKNAEIKIENEAYAIFGEQLEKVCAALAKMIARDGEGATKMISCTVTGAENERSAELLSMSVISSSLVKTAMTGADANWGRVLCAMGRAGVEFDPDAVNIAFESDAGRIDVCAKGRGIAFDEPLAKTILSQENVRILCDIKSGHAGTAETYGCDLTGEYVKINGEYRT
jgi:glutamate N-acetyltransferase/amino-acid N-acetyltransferase